jgi:hypothetical protein
MNEDLLEGVLLATEMIYPKVACYWSWVKENGNRTSTQKEYQREERIVSVHRRKEERKEGRGRRAVGVGKDC